MREPLKIVITATGEGSRMKAISPKPKHLLYYGGKRIIDCIVEALKPFGEVHVFGAYPGSETADNWMVCGPTGSRKEQLELLGNWKNVLIVDCDVIPVFAKPTFVPDFKEYFEWLPTQPNDYIFCFASSSPKYCGLHFTFDGAECQSSGCLESAIEHEVSERPMPRASGLYFLKDVGATADRMTDHNSIASGMIGAKMTPEQTFIRVGDPEDYLNALK